MFDISAIGCSSIIGWCKGSRKAEEKPALVIKNVRIIHKKVVYCT